MMILVIGSVTTTGVIISYANPSKHAPNNYLAVDGQLA